MMNTANLAAARPSKASEKKAHKASRNISSPLAHLSCNLVSLPQGSQLGQGLVLSKISMAL